MSNLEDEFAAKKQQKIVNATQELREHSVAARERALEEERQRQSEKHEAELAALRQDLRTAKEQVDTLTKQLDDKGKEYDKLLEQSRIRELAIDEAITKLARIQTALESHQLEGNEPPTKKSRFADSMKDRHTGSVAVAGSPSGAPEEEEHEQDRDDAEFLEDIHVQKDTICVNTETIHWQWEEISEQRETIRELRQSIHEHLENIREQKEFNHGLLANICEPKKSTRAHQTIRELRKTIREQREEIREQREEIREQREKIREQREEIREQREKIREQRETNREQLATIYADKKASREQETSGEKLETIRKQKETIDEQWETIHEQLKTLLEQEKTIKTLRQLIDQLSLPKSGTADQLNTYRVDKWRHVTAAAALPYRMEPQPTRRKMPAAATPEGEHQNRSNSGSQSFNGSRRGAIYGRGGGMGGQPQDSRDERGSSQNRGFGSQSQNSDWFGGHEAGGFERGGGAMKRPQQLCSLLSHPAPLPLLSDPAPLPLLDLSLTAAAALPYCMEPQPTLQKDGLSPRTGAAESGGAAAGNWRPSIMRSEDAGGAGSAPRRRGPSSHHSHQEHHYPLREEAAADSASWRLDYKLELLP